MCGALSNALASHSPGLAVLARPGVLGLHVVAASAVGAPFDLVGDVSLLTGFCLQVPSTLLPAGLRQRGGCGGGLGVAVVRAAAGGRPRRDELRRGRPMLLCTAAGHLWGRRFWRSSSHSAKGWSSRYPRRAETLRYYELQCRRSTLLHGEGQAVCTPRETLLIGALSSHQSRRCSIAGAPRLLVARRLQLRSGSRGGLASHSQSCFAPYAPALTSFAACAISSTCGVVRR